MSHRMSTPQDEAVVRRILADVDQATSEVAARLRFIANEIAAHEGSEVAATRINVEAARLEKMGQGGVVVALPTTGPTPNPARMREIVESIPGAMDELRALPAPGSEAHEKEILARAGVPVVERRENEREPEPQA